MKQILKTALLWLTLASSTPQSWIAKDGSALNKDTELFRCKVSDTLYTLWYSDSVTISNLKNQIIDEVNKIPDCTNDDKKFLWEVIDTPDFIDFINSNGWKSPFDIFHWILWLLSAFLTYLLLKEKKSKNKINASLLSKILNVVSLSSWRDLYQVVTSLLLDFSKDDNNEIHIDDNIRELFDKIPLCITHFKYDEVLIWNKKMEELSWFTRQQIQEEINKAKKMWINSPYAYVMYYDNINDNNTQGNIEFNWDTKEYDRVTKSLLSKPEEWSYTDREFTMLRRREELKDWETEIKLREKLSLLWTTTFLSNWHNFRIWREPNIKANIEFMRKIIDFIGYPISYYVPEKLPHWKTSSRPIIWNKALEKITWYSFEKIDELYNKWILLETLYPDDPESDPPDKERNRVLKFLDKLNKWESYTEPFTMTTNYEDGKWGFKKVTLLWSSEPYWFWWSFRIAKVIDEPLDIFMRKNDPTRKDEFTGVLNETALQQDMNLLFDSPELLYDPNQKVSIFLDIPSIDAIKNSHWEETSNKVLLKLSEILSSSTRRDSDIVHRVWNSFVLTFSWMDISNSLVRAQELVKEFKLQKFWIDWEISDIPLSLWIWWYHVKHEDFKNWKSGYENFIWIKNSTYYYCNNCLNNFKKVEIELSQRGINVSNYNEWDWIAYPLFDENWFMWVRIILPNKTFDLTKQETHKINERIQQKKT